MEHLALFMQDFRIEISVMRVASQGCSFSVSKHIRFWQITFSIQMVSFSVSCKPCVRNETGYKCRLSHLFICFNRKKKKNKDKKRKAADDEDKPDIVGMCVYYPTYLLIRWWILFPYALWIGLTTDMTTVPFVFYNNGRKIELVLKFLCSLLAKNGIFVLCTLKLMWWSYTKYFSIITICFTLHTQDIGVWDLQTPK